MNNFYHERLVRFGSIKTPLIEHSYKYARYWVDKYAKVSISGMFFSNVRF